MSNRIACLMFILCLTGSAGAQEAFYKHLEGKVGANISIVVDLVKSGERLSGYYYYFFDDISGDTTWIHYGKSMPVSGILKDNHFEFREFDPEVRGAVFRGIFGPDSIQGTWISADGKQQLPLSLSEGYPEGTMPFRVIYLNQSGQLFENKITPKASIEVSLLTPDDYSSLQVADSVRYNIYGHFFDLEGITADPDSLLNAIKELYFTNYRNSNADLYTEGASSFDWKKIKEVRILHNEKDILSLEYYDYGFTGGAHGLSISDFHVIDLKDGHQISLEEICREDYSNDLRDIINSAARKKYGLMRNQVMRDAGFFVEYLDPTSNFYLTKDGLGFYYNQYEVAPFALGPVEIFVSYRDLLRILKPGSPVYRLISPGK